MLYTLYVKACINSLKYVIIKLQNWGTLWSMWNRR